MQQIISGFGIQPVLLAAQIVNFLIILFLLQRFAFKPILKVLSDRKTTIAESLKNAEQTEKLLAQAQEKEKELLKKAQSQAQQLLTEARDQAVELQTASEKKTQEQVTKMLQDAEKKITEQTKQAEKQLATHVAQVAVNLLEKSLKGMIDDKDQQKVIEKAIKALK